MQPPRPTWRSRLVILLVLTACILLYALNTRAQDTAADCAPDFAALETLLTDAKAAPPDEMLTKLSELRAALAQADATCRGFSFSSEQDGQQPAIGPITLPNGTWRATVTTEDYVTVDFTELSGDCGDSSLIFILSAGEAASGAQQVFKTSGDCETLISFENVSDSWTFTLELLKDG